MLQTSSQPTIKVGVLNENNTSATKKHLPSNYEALKASLIAKLSAEAAKLQTEVASNENKTKANKARSK